jgi:hypothetical protein
MYKKWPILDGYAPSGHPGEFFIQRNSKFEEAYIFSPLWQDFSDPYAMRYMMHELDLVCTTIVNTIKASAINYFMLATVNQNGFKVLDPLHDSITGKIRTQKSTAENMGFVTTANLILLSYALYVRKDKSIMDVIVDRNQIKDEGKVVDSRTTNFTKPLKELIRTSALPKVEELSRFLYRSFINLSDEVFLFIQSVLKDLLLNQAFTRPLGYQDKIKNTAIFTWR